MANSSTRTNRIDIVVPNDISSNADIAINPSGTGVLDSQKGFRGRGIIRFDSANDATSGSNVTLTAPATKVVRLTSGSLVSVDMIPAGAAGQELILVNATGTTITLSDNVGATAANRIYTGLGSDITVNNQSSVIMSYDTTSARWLVISRVIAASGGSGGYTTSTVTSNTTMAVGNAYITNSASLLEMKLPASSAVGDVIRILGRGTGKFKVVTNASASTQKIFRDTATSNVSSSSVIDVLLATNQYSCVDIECTVANSEWTVYNDISTTLVSDTNYWGTGADGNVTISSNTNLSATTDGDMIVKNYNDLTVNSGVTLTTDNRCRGALLYVKGNLVVNGTISMTARGCKANPATVGTDGNTPVAASDGNAVPSTGIQIRRKKTGQTSSNSLTTLFHGCGNAAVTAEANQAILVSNGQVFTITRTGANGGTGQSTTTNQLNGVSGSNGTTGQSGGGGSGALQADSFSASTGAGGAGTCFSGGAASGGVSTVNSGITGTAGNSFGGAGGNAIDGSLNEHGGGAGNPGGQWIGQSIPNYAGQDGTGGTLIIIVRGTITIGASGIIEAKGSRGGGYSGMTGLSGGGSGGGNIVILYGGSVSNSGTITAAGGNGGLNSGAGISRSGGVGGVGSIQGPTIIDL